MKYIFLDEFVWFNLRRSICNETNAPDLGDVIKCIETKVKSGEWAFPISAEHLTETSNTGDDVKRLVTSFIMDEISRGYTIRQFSQLKDFEIDLMLQGKNPIEYRENIIKQDILNIWGKSGKDIFIQACMDEGMEPSEELYQQVQYLLSGRVTNKYSITLSMQNKSIISSDTKTMYKEIMNNLKRQDIEHPYVSLEQFLMYTLEQYYSDEQQIKILTFINEKLSPNDSSRNLHNLFLYLPTYYTNCALIYKDMKMQEKSKEFHENDFVDMLYLSYMIPYCDVVVTEKKWVNIAKQMKLDKEFSTVIISDAKELLKL